MRCVRSCGWGTDRNAPTSAYLRAATQTGERLRTAIVRGALSLPVRQPRAKTEKPSGATPCGYLAERVEIVEKEAVLAMVEQMEQEAEAQMQAVLGVAHSEDVSGWAEAIERWLVRQSSEVAWSELEAGLGMPWVELCLGLLLGGFQMEQRGEFYQRETIWVAED
jgi:hypothetical protein